MDGFTTKVFCVLKGVYPKMGNEMLFDPKAKAAAAQKKEQRNTPVSSISAPLSPFRFSASRLNDAIAPSKILVFLFFSLSISHFA